MSDEPLRWQVGDIRITSILEAQTDGIPPAFFFPNASEEDVQRHPWLVPHYADADGRMGLRVQAFVIEAGDRTLVVDPCVGNGKQRNNAFWNDQYWPFMERFEAAGFTADAIETVVHTHLHVDHVGWDTHLVDEKWVPTFTNARYLYVDTELDWASAETEYDTPQVYADSIAPVLDAGLADIVTGDADLGDGLRLEPTIGHTPGHASLWIESDGMTALVTGDVIHHPVQCAEPQISFVSDHDSAQAEATRALLLQRAHDAGALVLGTHFPTKPAGRLVADGTVWRFEPV